MFDRDVRGDGIERALVPSPALEMDGDARMTLTDDRVGHAEVRAQGGIEADGADEGVGAGMDREVSDPRVPDVVGRKDGTAADAPRRERAPATPTFATAAPLARATILPLLATAFGRFRLWLHKIEQGVPEQAKERAEHDVPPESAPRAAPCEQPRQDF
jgi:hypothetical protein